MEEREPNLKSIQENENNFVISDKERQSVVIQTKIFSVFTFVVICFIVEALIHQHPVFPFLQYQYNIFKEESIILGSISLAISFLGYTIILIALENAILVNYQFNKNTYFFTVMGIIMMIGSFIILYQSYNWDLGYLQYFAHLFLMISLTGEVVIRFAKKGNLFIPYKKVFQSIFFIFFLIYVFSVFINS